MEPVQHSLSSAMEPAAAGLFPYQCPGEPAPISEGVHLSRLAAFYGKCRHCVHRTDISRLSPGLRSEWESMLAQAEPDHLFGRDGVRGRAHSHWTPREATQLAAAYLSVLTEVLDVQSRRSPGPRNSAPRVVLGYDTRAESPVFAVAMARTLRQHGAELIDLGWTTRPRVEQRLRTSGAAGAVFVTGSGCESGWTGADLLGPDGIVWSREGILDLVEQRFHTLVPRPVREAGPHHTEIAIEESHDVWAREFHGLRPLQIRVRPAEFLQRELLEKVRPLIPGLELASPESRPTGATTALLDVAFEWGEDSRSCRVFDGQGSLVSSEALAFQFGSLLLDDHPHVDVVVSDVIFEQWGRTVTRCGPGYLVFHHGGTTEEQLRRTMESLQAPLGLDGADRYWIRRGGNVVCDSLLTMAFTLRALSRSDGAVSNWLVPAA